MTCPKHFCAKGCEKPSFRHRGWPRLCRSARAHRTWRGTPLCSCNPWATCHGKYRPQHRPVWSWRRPRLPEGAEGGVQFSSSRWVGALHRPLKTQRRWLRPWSKVDFKIFWQNEQLNGESSTLRRSRLMQNTGNLLSSAKARFALCLSKQVRTQVHGTSHLNYCFASRPIYAACARLCQVEHENSRHTDRHQVLIEPIFWLMREAIRLERSCSEINADLKPSRDGLVGVLIQPAASPPSMLWSSMKEGNSFCMPLPSTIFPRSSMQHVKCVDPQHCQAPRAAAKSSSTNWFATPRLGMQPQIN